MSASISQLLGMAATAYGVIAPLSALLQARQMLARRSSREVSVRFFASYAGGYAIWLLYGLSAGSTPLIVVDAVGVLCAGLTLAVALALRGSLVRLASWTGRAAIPVPGEGPEPAPAAIANAVAASSLARTSPHPPTPNGQPAPG
jgi:MtN3 and saliva related transmembrane protein